MRRFALINKVPDKLDIKVQITESTLDTLFDMILLDGIPKTADYSKIRNVVMANSTDNKSAFEGAVLNTTGYTVTFSSSLLGRLFGVIGQEQYITVSTTVRPLGIHETNLMMKTLSLMMDPTNNNNNFMLYAYSESMKQLPSARIASHFLSIIHTHWSFFDISRITIKDGMFWIPIQSKVNPENAVFKRLPILKNPYVLGTVISYMISQIRMSVYDVERYVSRMAGVLTTDENYKYSLIMDSTDEMYTWFISYCINGPSNRFTWFMHSLDLD